MRLGNRQVGTGLHTARLGRRRRVEELLGWAAYLGAEERLVVEGVYREGLTLREVAARVGKPVGWAQRRLGRGVRRLRHPLFRFVAKRAEALPVRAQAAVRLCVLEGRTMREAASATGQTLHAVRTQMVAARSVAAVAG